jgi:hypothetical protein
MKEAWSQQTFTLPGTCGPIRGYRNNIYAFPTQNAVRPSSGSHYTIAGVVSTRSFYQTTTNQLGSYPGVLASASLTGNAVNGPVWVVCEDTSTTVKCNGGASYNGTAAGGFANRLVAKVDATAAF